MSFTGSKKRKCWIWLRLHSLHPAIAINGAIVVGYKLAGSAGVLVSIIGTVIPPFVIIALLSVCYNAFRTNELVSQMLEGMQAGVGAVIA